MCGLSNLVCLQNILILSSVPKNVAHFKWSKLNRIKVTRLVLCQTRYNCFELNLRLQHLKEHTNSVHMEVKNYNCDQCEMKFARRQTLKRHLESVHLKLKNFKCDHCSMFFARKQHLTSHQVPSLPIK